MKTFALIGTPNSGKTALFNALTGSTQKVANYAGVTVEGTIGRIDSDIEILDLPGTYSLRPKTEEERVAVRVLKREDPQYPIDGVLLVLDATQMWRNLGFVLEVMELKLPTVVALNMTDLAKERGIQIDTEKLSEKIGAPVVSIVASRRKGIERLIERIRSANTQSNDVISQISNQPETNAHVLERFKKVDQIYKTCVQEKKSNDRFSRKVDRILLHPVFGPLILIVVLGTVFQLMFNFAKIPMDWIDAAFRGLIEWCKHVLPGGWLRDLLTEGVLSGVGTTMVFLPQILILFSAILFLEDFGYMARAVFLLDSLMSKVGLQGKSFIPLFSSFACAIPGIMSTRTIENKRDRLTTILMAPLMTCSARIPVYSLLIGCFVPNTDLGFGIRLQGVVMLGLYFFGVIAALAVAFVFRKLVFRGGKSPLLIELPSYKWPQISSLLRGIWLRTKMFLNRVTQVIVGLTIVIWFLVSFPKAHNGDVVDINQSYAAKIGKAFEPAIRPLGFDWKIGMAILPAFAAREVMVSALTTAYAVESENESVAQEKLSATIKKEWTVATGLSLIIWFVFAPQCISTLAVVRRETGGWTWSTVMGLYLMALAYLGSFVTFQVASRLFS